MRCDVIIITFNRIKYLKELLESIDNQIKFIGKIIVFDDLSTDGTREFLENYRISNENIHVIFPEHKALSVGQSRNTALSLVENEFCVVFDDDDLFVPDKLLNSMIALKESGSDWAYGDCIEFGTGPEKVIRLGSDYRKLLTGRNNIRWVSTIFKSNVLKEVRFNDEVQLITDWCLYRSLIQRGHLPTYVPKILGRYRIHFGSFTKKKDVLVNDLRIFGSEVDEFRADIYLWRSMITSSVVNGRFIEGARLLWFPPVNLGLKQWSRTFVFFILGLKNVLNRKVDGRR